ncbi:MAG: biotin--[acetyl-CoA-carboxylase] ligase [Planctomycetia bacterium]|nr:biotin--[acetyl-CoA-carboxylase] ligase [Planctomycetia bacterium]
MPSADPLKPPEEWQLTTQRLGRRVLVYDETDSTSNRAAELAHNRAYDGIAILAKTQTAGRGQHGRRWQCPPCSGVLLSVLLFPPPPLRRPAILTAWAAVSVCETILQAGNVQAKIKWPNDVLLHGRKVCGILIEQRSGAQDAPGGVIAGIGLNVSQQAADFTAPGLENGTSLQLTTGRKFDWTDIAQRLLAQLDVEYDRLCHGDLTTLEACWKWRLGLLGRTVEADCADEVHRGRLLEIGWDGLHLERPNGAHETLLPEAVRQLREANRV